MSAPRLPPHVPDFRFSSPPKMRRRDALKLAALIGAGFSLDRGATAQDSGSRTGVEPPRELEAPDPTEMKRWVTEQTRRTRAFLSQHPVRPWVEGQLRALSLIESPPLPILRGNQAFFEKRDPGKPRPTLCVRNAAGGEARPLLDTNDTNIWPPTAALGMWKVSPDGRYVLLEQRPNNADEATWLVLDVARGELLQKDTIVDQPFAEPYWDGSGFIYAHSPSAAPTREAQRQRIGQRELLRHEIGTTPNQDVQVRKATGDAGAYQSAWLDGKHLVSVVFVGRTRTELSWKRVGSTGDFTRLSTGAAINIPAGSDGDKLFILSHDGAPSGELISIDLSNPARPKKRRLIKEEPGSTLEDAQVVGGKLVLKYRREGANELRVTDLQGRHAKTLPLPPFGEVKAFEGSADQPELYVAHSSPASPPAVWRFDVRNLRGEMLPSPGSKSVALGLVCRLEHATASDGTKLAMHVLHRADLDTSQSHPVWQQGYALFGHTTSRKWDPAAAAFALAGGVSALVSVRESPPDTKRGERIQTAISDYQDAGADLSRKYSPGKKIVSQGSSAGGFLVTAAANQRPDLYAAVIAVNPLTDLLELLRKEVNARRYMDELGNPGNPADRADLEKVSPLRNLPKNASDFPAVLVSTGDDDTRVNPEHGSQYVRKLQAAGSGRAYLLNETSAGHAGSADPVAQRQRAADFLTFAMDATGMKVPSPERASDGGGQPLASRKP